VGINESDPDDEAGHDLEQPPFNPVQAFPAPIDGDTAEGSQLLMQFAASYHQGPMPSPEVLKAYVEIYPDAAKVIFRTYERQVNHRHEMEAEYMHGSEARAKVGQICGMIVLMTALVGAIGLGFAGQTTIAVVLGTGALASGALTYLFGIRRAKKKRKKSS